MREIKFRGKRLDNGEWLYGSLVILNGRYFIFDDANRHEVDPTTVGEFTGLKDKNGKEIYEGDVIALHCPRIKLVLIESFTIPATQLLWGALVDRKELCYLRLDQDWIYKFGKEVIGNIHDNLELLKGGEQ
jgi:uncharacterized phage protein (TIGR01671 family)